MPPHLWKVTHAQTRKSTHEPSQSIELGYCSRPHRFPGIPSLLQDWNTITIAGRRHSVNNGSHRGISTKADYKNGSNTTGKKLIFKNTTPSKAKIRSVWLFSQQQWCICICECLGWDNLSFSLSWVLWVCSYPFPFHYVSVVRTESLPSGHLTRTQDRDTHTQCGNGNYSSFLNWILLVPVSLNLFCDWPPVKKWQHSDFL